MCQVFHIYQTAESLVLTDNGNKINSAVRRLLPPKCLPDIVWGFLAKYLKTYLAAELTFMPQAFMQRNALNWLLELAYSCFRSS